LYFFSRKSNLDWRSERSEESVQFASVIFFILTSLSSSQVSLDSNSLNLSSKESIFWRRIFSLWTFSWCLVFKVSFRLSWSISVLYFSTTLLSPSTTSSSSAFELFIGTPTIIDATDSQSESHPVCCFSRFVYPWVWVLK